MTYAELFAEAAALLPAQSFQISVETWRHVHGGTASIETEWTVYCVSVKHCAGKSPEEALAALKDALKRQIDETTAKPEPVLDGVSAVVGDAQVSQ